MKFFWSRTSPKPQSFRFFSPVVFACRLSLCFLMLLLGSGCISRQNQGNAPAKPERGGQTPKTPSLTQSPPGSGTDLFVCEKGPLEASCQALVHLYRSSTATWDEEVKNSWLKQAEICQWKGVTCNDEKTQVILLFLRRQKITKLPTEALGLPSLESLELSYNQLQSVPPGLFSGLSSLQSLSLSDNQLRSVPPGLFSGLSSLRWLDLERNQLQLLPEGLFSGLSSLKYLFLYKNQLQSVPEGLFSGLPSLQWLLLSDNQFQSLPPGLFSGLPSLEYLDLRENPLKAGTKLSETLCKAIARVSPPSLCPTSP